MQQENESTHFKNHKPRLLILEGKNGSVACRIHDNLASKTIPRYTGHHFTWATATLLRLTNLEAVRGTPGESMVGPCDLYCTLEEPHKYAYSLKLKNGFPTFQAHRLEYEEQSSSGSCLEMQDFSPPKLKQINEELVTRVKATWVSGRDTNTMFLKKREYDAMGVSMFGDSLFLERGLLEIEGEHLIELKPFDAREFDLSSFKARLVDNDCPFQLTSKPLAASDEFRAVSYLYEKGYACRQVREGGGLFLERHPFSQTMTPLDESAKGFMTVARWNETGEELEILAIKIPYGYTLIVEDDCIHGDTTFSGKYLMCMTSNHFTMREADTVFLKNKTTKQNMSMSIDEENILELNKTNETSDLTEIADNELTNDTQKLNERSELAPSPLVLYKGSSKLEKEQFNSAIRNHSLICNPKSPTFWSSAVSTAKYSIRDTAQSVLKYSFGSKHE